MEKAKASLAKKRLDAIMRILVQVSGTSVASAAPTPALETAKQLGILATDAWMCWDIYKIYFDKELSSSDDLVSLLGVAGVVVVGGGLAGYAALKVAQSFADELLNALPVAGWAISGLLTGSSSGVLGLAWMAFVDSQYSESH